MKLKTAHSFSWLMALRSVWLVLFFALTLAGCASGQAGSVVDHGFAFTAWKDSPDIQVLAYSYGNSRNPYYGNRLSANEQDTKNGQALQGTTITGEIPVGKYLYVKWRIKATGEVLEDTVDLQTAWQQSLRDWKIYFIIEDRQLYVYLLSQLKNRPYFTTPQVLEINDFASRSPRQRALSTYALRYVEMIYPHHQLDPHLPPDLRRKR